MVNLISNDVNRFDIACRFILFLTIGPLQTVGVTYFLWQEIGVSSVIGVTVFLAFVPLQGTYEIDCHLQYMKMYF